MSNPSLDARIRDTYAARSDATNRNALYDSYIRSIRWASDRIGNAGIIGFVTNAGFAEANTADNLSKELARIPAVKKAADFWAFSKAGRALANLHLNYETVEPYALTIEAKGTLSDADYRVEKMKFAKKGDKSTVIYNHRIILKGIPEAAWDYVVNGKTALGWVMERQAVRTDKASGIVNDANDWAIETMANFQYPLELFQRVVTVSLETMKIVNGLLPLDI